MSTRTQFSVCRPEKMRLPRLGWPTVVASVAAPIVQTAAVRMPARITGAPSGSSTRRKRWRGRHAEPVGGLDHGGIDALERGDAVAHDRQQRIEAERDQRRQEAKRWNRETASPGRG